MIREKFQRHFLFEHAIMREPHDARPAITSIRFK